MENLTEVEDHPFADVDLDNDTVYSPSTLEVVTHHWVVVTFLLKFLLCVVNISASIFLMVMVMKFRKLRTRTNMYLFHYALNNTLYYLLLPIVIIFLITFGINLGRVSFCIVNKFEDFFLILIFIFAGGSALDFYTVHLSISVSVFYKKIYRYLIFVLYSCGILKLLVGIGICFAEHRYMKHTISAFIFPIFCIIMIYLNILDHKSRKGNSQHKPRYTLPVANIIFLSWLPLFVYEMLFIYVTPHHDEPVRMFLNFTAFIPEFLAHGHTIVVVYMLGRLNKNFKMAYSMSFKRGLRVYDHNDLDQSEEEAVVHHQVNEIKPQESHAEEPTKGETVIQVNGSTKDQNDTETVNTEEAFIDTILRH